MESARDELADISKDNLDVDTQSTSISRYLLINLLRKMWPILILACLIPVYTYYAYSTKLVYFNAYRKSRSEKTDAPPQLKLYNSSLAHMWTKEGVKGVALIDCDKDCTE